MGAGRQSAIVTFLFADVEGSTRLKQGHPDSADGALAVQLAILQSVIATREGRVFNAVGDGTFAVFSTPDDAVRAALDIHRGLGGYDWSQFGRGFPPLTVRIGIHTGRSKVIGDGYEGIALNRTARIMAAAHGGQTLISRATRELLRDAIPAEIELVFRGEHRLKDLLHAERLYEAVVAGSARTDRPLATAGVVRRVSLDAATPFDRLREIIAGDNVPIPQELAEEVRRIAPGNLDEYCLTRIAEWSSPHFLIDRQFVRLTVLLDRGPDVAVNRWQPAPELHDELQDVLGLTESAIVLLGPPGGGKTTLLRRLEFDLAQEVVKGGSNLFPIFMSLSQYSDVDGEPLGWVSDRWAARYPALPPLRDLLRDREVVFLLDGLNEMIASSEQRLRTAVLSWKRFIADVAYWSPRTRMVFSCRTLDYGAPLSSSTIPVPQVKIEPLSDDQIRIFLKRYAPVTWQQLWTALQSTGHTEAFRRPYLLTLLVGQSAPSVPVPIGLAGLFTAFVRGSLRREIERDNPLFAPNGLVTVSDVRHVIQNVWRGPYHLPDSGLLIASVEKLARRVQMSRPDGEKGRGTVALSDLPRLVPEVEPAVLRQAGENLDLLSEDPHDDTLSFRHQLLQEYFAARTIGIGEIEDLAAVPWRLGEVDPPLEALLPTLSSSEPIPPAPTSGWDETVRLATAMAENSDEFVRRIAHVNLALAGECAAAPELAEALSRPLRKRLSVQLQERSRDRSADPRSRIAAAIAAGKVGHAALVEVNGALHAPMVRIDGGSYVIGSGDDLYSEEEPVHQIELAPFLLGSFPVTNAEWARFVEDGGYEDVTWWLTEASREWLRGESTADGAKYNVVIRLAEFRENPSRLDYFLAEGSLSQEHYDLWKDRLGMSTEALQSHLDTMFPSAVVRQPRYWGTDDYGSPAQPVVGICWYEALAYCAWLRSRSGLEFRLPSEAEWEAAARGQSGRRFAYGDDFDSTVCNTVESHWRRPTPIGVLCGGETPEGLTDMTGNVFEWTSSSYARQPYVPVFPYPYDPNDGREDLDTPGEYLRVMRGGCWAYPKEDARCAVRLSVHPANRQSVDGLRLCLSDS